MSVVELVMVVMVSKVYFESEVSSVFKKKFMFLQSCSHHTGIKKKVPVQLEKSYFLVTIFGSMLLASILLN